MRSRRRAEPHRQPTVLPGGGSRPVLPDAKEAILMDEDTRIVGGRVARAALILSVLTVFTAVVATVAALVAPDRLQGPAVMIGSMRGTALVMLLLGMPILVLGMVAGRDGRLLGIVGWIGGMVFMAYQAWMFVFA